MDWALFFSFYHPESVDTVQIALLYLLLGLILERTQIAYILFPEHFFLSVKRFKCMDESKDKFL